MSQQLAVQQQSISKVEKLSQQLASRLNLGVDGRELVETLKETAFRGQVSDSQMAALLIVAEQYGLNPWTKEIYAFPDSKNGIVPVVGVDGWARIINGNSAFDGMEFVQDEQSCTCKIYRKDRSHPTSVTEYMSECRRDNVQPWKTHPRRMLRHKSMIQCARIAFGFGGIYDEDEAERIVQKPQEREINPQPIVQPEKPAISNDGLNKSIAKITSGGDLTIDRLLANRELNELQMSHVKAWQEGAEWTDLPVEAAQ
jgi:phage recombination protein Bet